MDIIGRSCMFITSESYSLKIHSQPFASPQHHHWQQWCYLQHETSLRSGFSFFNLLTPESDQNLIFPHSISLNRVTRIKEMVTNLLNSWFLKQILLVSTLENIWRTVWRIFILMLGCEGLWGQLPFKTGFFPPTFISPPA